VTLSVASCLIISCEAAIKAFQYKISEIYPKINPKAK
jgi:hypothetical protein